MHTYLRNKPVWMQLIIFGGLTGGIFVAVLWLGVIGIAQLNHLSVAQIGSMTPADYARPELTGVIRGLLIVQFLGIFLLPSLVFSYLADPNPLYYAGFRPPQKNYFFLIAAVTMIVAYFTVELMAAMNESLVRFLPAATQKWIQSGEADANGTLENILSMKTTRDLMVNIFLVAAVPAIGEELFFRGILQKLFIQIFRRPWAGIIFTGFLFSAFHMQFLGFLPRMALGIILGALYWYSGSILTSMLGHFIFNTINIFLIYFKYGDLETKSGNNISFTIIGLLSLAAVVFLLNYLRKKSTTTFEGEFPPIAEPSIFDDPETRV